MGLDHPNIARIIDVWQWDKLLFIVMDFFEGGDLYQMLDTRGFFEEYEVYTILKQMTSILIYLRDKKVNHRDLNLKNFMLRQKDDLSNIQLVDFGLSKELGNINTQIAVSGTPYYVAPENLVDYGILQSDIWSLGIIIYVLLSGKES